MGGQVELIVRGKTPLRYLEPKITELLLGEMEASNIKVVTETELSGISLATDGTKSVQTKGGDAMHGYDEVRSSPQPLRPPCLSCSSCSLPLLSCGPCMGSA